MLYNISQFIYNILLEMKNLTIKVLIKGCESKTIAMNPLKNIIF